MGTAIELAAKLREDDRARVAALRDRLATGIVTAIRDARLNGEPDQRLPNICHVTIPGIESETLLLLLDREGICAAAGSSCSSGAADPSHVLAAMGVPPDRARSSVRFSLGWCSSEAEVDAALAVIPAGVVQLRARGR
jgi:cysteine desulfurase